MTEAAAAASRLVRTAPRADARLGTTTALAAFALVARGVVVAWAAGRFPPAADGHYYHVLASRLAMGAGYTWAWPDGSVTYAAHYPVGYPAMLAALYAVFGAHPVLGMILNALLGAAGVAAAHRVMLRVAPPRAALVAGVVSALHPALLLYTPALMTEGVTASLLLVALALAPRPGARAWPRWVAGGAVMGVATLVRPQCILVAPGLGFVYAMAGGLGVRARFALAAGLTAMALAVCAPWTARNCARMHRCALVSVNGGWNLLIGAQTDSGAWSEIVVPDGCKTVWDEAGKDTCFERAARASILAHPLAWMARAPAKLAVTFDYFGAAPWYLHESGPAAFSERAKVALGTVETIVSRLLLLLALALGVPWRGRTLRQRGALAAGAAGIVFAVGRTAWPSYGLLALLLVLAPRDKLLSPFVAYFLAATMATHAVFFGAGRYGLVVVPFVTLLAFVRLRARAPGGEGACVSDAPVPPSVVSTPGR